MSFGIWVFRSVVLLALCTIAVNGKNGNDTDYEIDNVNENENENDDEFTFLISGGYRLRMNFIAKYIVSIRTSRPTAYYGDNHFCSGTIIASHMILTAAHCVMDSNKIVTRPRRLTVVAGAPNRLQNTGVEMKVEAVIPHTGFIRRGGHDIAVLRLTDPVPETNDLIAILPLAHKAPVVGLVCTVGGWGQIFYNGPFTAEPVYANLTIFEAALCKQFYPNFFAEGMICAGDEFDDEMEACRGDSGAPLVCNGRLTGIVSWGMRCAKPGYPSVFTDVFYHRVWLQSINGAQTLLVRGAFLLPLALSFNSG